MLGERPDRTGVDADDPLMAALGGALDAYAIHDAHRASDPHRRRRTKIDVGPAQVQQFPATRPGERGDVEEGVQPMSPRGGQKRGELLGVPHPGSLQSESL